MGSWAWLTLLALGLGQFDDVAEKVPPNGSRPKPAAKAPKKIAPKSGKGVHKALPTTVAGHVAEMLNEGFTHGPHALRAAQREHAAAHRLDPDDPRVEYAFGLVQSRQLHHQAALTQFKLAVEKGNKPFWPAWQALIWSECCDKKYADGLGRLVQFAQIVQNNEGEAAGPRDDAANWIGQVLEGLDETLDGDRDRIELANAEAKILAALDDELKGAVDHGRAIVREKWRLLSQQASDVVEQRSKQDVATSKQKAGQIDAQVEGIGKEREANTRTRDQWEEWIEEQIPPIDKQLAQLERDYLYLDRRLGSLSQSIALATRELTVLEWQAAQYTNPAQANQLGPLQLALQSRRGVLFTYQLDYNATAARMTGTTQAADALLKRRSFAVEQYQAATGELLKKNNQLAKWSMRLGEKKKKLEHHVPAKELQENLDRKLESFRTYVELDLEAEKLRLLESYGIAPPEPVEEPVPAPAKAPMIPD